MRILLNLLLAPLFVFGQGEQRYADGTATDQDGNTFELINYGTQDWSIENAEVVTYRDGTEIPQVTDDGIWTDLTTGAWCYFDNDPSKGKLYNAYAIIGKHDNDENTPNKEFAPQGWHVPSNSEWGTLESYLIVNRYNYDQTNTGNKIALSMTSTTGWNASEIQGSPGYDQSIGNKSGFNAPPDGFKNPLGDFQDEGLYAAWWSHIDYSLSSLFYINITNASLNLSRNPSDVPSYGNSVRFVRDAADTEAPVITLIGESPVSIDQDATYSDQGATATDNVDGDITANIIVTSNVDTSTVGTYTVTYNVSDAAGNAATPLVRIITVNPVEINPYETGILLNGTVSAENNQIKNVADPTEAQDVVTKAYIDALIAGLQSQLDALQNSSSVTDIDGNSYDYLTYGDQVWTVENSETETYRDGTPIPQVTDVTEWQNLTTGAWCYYDNDPTKGKLYNWYAAAGIHDNDPNTPNKKLAPEGWHVPTDNEWTTFENYLIANGYNYDGNTTENKIAKAMASTSGWDIYNSNNGGVPSNDQSLNNSSGFNAYPKGGLGNLGYSDDPDKPGDGSAGGLACFWSTTKSSNDAYCYYLAYHRPDLATGINPEWQGFSVRFVRD
jgi:uncharacterized protein (TIGR02145 family)